MPDRPAPRPRRPDSIADAVAAVVVVLILTAMATHFASG